MAIGAVKTRIGRVSLGEKAVPDGMHARDDSIGMQNSGTVAEVPVARQPCSVRSDLVGRDHVRLISTRNGQRALDSIHR